MSMLKNIIYILKMPSSGGIYITDYGPYIRQHEKNQAHFKYALRFARKQEETAKS